MFRSLCPCRQGWGSPHLWVEPGGSLQGPARVTPNQSFWRGPQAQGCEKQSFRGRGPRRSQKQGGRRHWPPRSGLEGKLYVEASGPRVPPSPATPQEFPPPSLPAWLSSRLDLLPHSADYSNSAPSLGCVKTLSCSRKPSQTLALPPCAPTVPLVLSPLASMSRVPLLPLFWPQGTRRNLPGQLGTTTGWAAGDPGCVSGQALCLPSTWLPIHKVGCRSSGLQGPLTVVALDPEAQGPTVPAGVGPGTGRRLSHLHGLLL